MLRISDKDVARGMQGGEDGEELEAATDSLPVSRQIWAMCNTTLADGPPPRHRGAT